LAFLSPTLTLMGAEPPRYLFNDSSNPLLGRSYNLQKHIVYDKKTFATIAELSAYLQHRMEKGTAEFNAQNASFQDEAAIKALLDTGHKYLQYDVANPELGIGIDGKGNNLYGQILMVLRAKIRNEQKQISKLRKLPAAKL